MFWSLLANSANRGVLNDWFESGVCLNNLLRYRNHLRFINQGHARTLVVNPLP